jgi:hypothetical protein
VLGWALQAHDRRGQHEVARGAPLGWGTFRAIGRWGVGNNASVSTTGSSCRDDGNRTPVGVR